MIELEYTELKKQIKDELKAELEAEQEVVGWDANGRSR